jgi:integrase
MEVYKRAGSRSWYVDLTDPVTKDRSRKSLRFTGSKVKAQALADELQVSLRAEAVAAKDGKRAIALGTAVEMYVTSLEATGKVSARNHRYRMGQLFGTTHAKAPISPLQAPMLDPAAPLHELRPDALEALSLARSRAGKKPQTIKHDIMLVKAATRYVGGLGFRTPEVLVRGDVKNAWRVPKVAMKTRYLSVDEYTRVYVYLHPGRPINGRPLPNHLYDARQESQDLLVALAYTGARWSEIAHLTWDRVDFKAKQITLWAGKVERERVVPIAQPLYEVLERRIRVVVQRPAWTIKGLVFPGPQGRPRTKPTDAIGEAMNAVGLNDPATVARFGKATIHSLRHTFASWLVQNGADLGEVQDALGHSSITTTTRYAHLSKGATVAKLGGILSKIGASDG